MLSEEWNDLPVRGALIKCPWLVCVLCVHVSDFGPLATKEGLNKLVDHADNMDINRGALSVTLQLMGETKLVPAMRGKLSGSDTHCLVLRGVVTDGSEKHWICVQFVVDGSAGH